MAILEVQHLSKQQPDRIIIDDISFQQVAWQNTPIPAITRQFPEISNALSQATIINFKIKWWNNL
ncbi:MAG TPA: hypothetical protein VN726_05180 [Hanamia sp.]|nr:hypothetical protein [Hanamia sp.]